MNGLRLGRIFGFTVRVDPSWFIVFILGGTNNYIGTLVAGLIIGLAEALSSLYMRPPELAAAVPYLIFTLFLLVRPKGILER